MPWRWLAGAVAFSASMGALEAQPPPVDAARPDPLHAVASPAPTWFAAEGPRPAVDAALRELRGAAGHGLEPGDYGVEALERLVDAARGSARDPEAVTRADAALAAAFQRFLFDLRYGRALPARTAAVHRTRAREEALVGRLRDAVAGDRLESFVAAAEPAFPQYARLKQLLARYRMLAAQPSPGLAPLATPRGKIEVGDAYAGAHLLRQQLIRLGDMAAQSADPEPDTRVQPPADPVYSPALSEAIRRFQFRHGLLADGVLGRNTMEALGVPMATRVSQIVLSLERLRWLPEFAPGPLIAVNIPSFQLVAFEDARTALRPALSMPVVVGRAVRHETPVFVGEMRHLEFSPYWNVPRNILRNELLPLLGSDPGYLAREGMEIVGTRPGGAVFAPDGTAGLEALRAGDARLRQRPGPKNALGGVKFVLPNTMDIYLHATPARQLFERERRDFSHGCIRVRDPAALAQFVLGGRPQWSLAAIEAAMASGVNRIVPLAAPIPVVVFYTTALVDAEGRARFLPDIYGHDRKLLDAMRR